MMNNYPKLLASAIALSLGTASAYADSVYTWGGWRSGGVGGSTIPETITAFNAIISNDSNVSDNPDNQADPVAQLVNNFYNGADYRGYSALASTHTVDTKGGSTTISGTVGTFAADMGNARVTGPGRTTRDSTAVSGRLIHLSIFSNSAVGGTDTVNGYSKNNEPTQFFGDYYAKGTTLLGGEGKISGNYRVDNSVANPPRRANYRIHNVTGEFSATNTGEGFSDTSSIAFVGGTETPLSFLNGLSAEGYVPAKGYHIYSDGSGSPIMADYYGTSLIYDQSVSINVNFTDASWKGSWGGGDDAPEFRASGDIRGVSIVSTGVSGDGISGGTVNGNFIGDEAQGLIGSSKVDDVKGNTYTDVFNTDAMGRRPG